MIVPLLPVFLVASLSVNESDWSYGPEVIYDGKINGSESRMVDEPDTPVRHITTMKLKCRPKNTTIFSCRFTKPKVVMGIYMRNGNISKTLNVTYPSNFDHPFEINVDPDRQDDNHVYIVSSSVTERQIDIIRVFMDTLIVPAFMTKLRDGDVDLYENSTIGIQCLTKYVTSSITLKEDSRGMNETKSYEILIAPKTNIPKGQEKSMSRKRFPKKCYNMLVGAVPNNDMRQAYRMWDRTEMNITRNTFISEEKGTFIYLGDTSHSRRVNGERITLTLEDIVPARSPLPVIRDPVTYGTAGKQVFHTKSFYD